MQFQTLKRLRSEIWDSRNNMGRSEQTKIRRLRSIRTKRLVPLGIIGSISHSLFGLTTIDEVGR